MSGWFRDYGYFDVNSACEQHFRSRAHALSIFCSLEYFVVRQDASGILVIMYLVNDRIR